MQYRENKKNNTRLSVLGYGCMRFSKTAGIIDQKKAEEEMKKAIDLGVNYFDTAYIYPGSEVALGKFLSKGYRDKVYIADKLPHYLMKKPEDFETYFQEMLRRLQTDHIDYFLIHMLNDIENFERICDMGIREWIAGKKADGSIRNIGFSFHGNTDMFKKLIDAYEWEFCQVQFNYMDEHSQAGIEGIRYAKQKDLPVIIMEPLRGGRLVQGLPDKAKKLLESQNPPVSPAKLGLQWIYNHEEINVVLSGMNDLKQVTENAEIANDTNPGSMTKEDLDLVKAVKEEILRYIKVPCTGCGYCQPCPAGVDIPSCFQAYNAHYSTGFIKGMEEYLKCTTLKKNPTNASLCMKCGKCEKHCPQSLPIREYLQDVVRVMEGPTYKITAAVMKKFTRFE